MSDSDALIELRASLDTLKQDLAQVVSIVNSQTAKAAATGRKNLESMYAGMFDKIEGQQQASLARQNAAQVEYVSKMSTAQRQYADIAKSVQNEVAQNEVAALNKMRTAQQQYADTAIAIQKQIQVAGGSRNASLLQNFMDQRSANSGVTSQMRQFVGAVGAAGGRGKFLKTPQGAGMSKDDLANMLNQADQLGVSINRIPSFYTKMINRFGEHLLQWTAWGILIDGSLKGVEAIEQAVSKSSEFQQQGILFQASQAASKQAGVATPGAPPAGNPQLLQDATILASHYGDEINNVVQDITLWTKETGNYQAALSQTNEALKFNLATGTQLEDVYRTVTALSLQSGDVGFDAESKRAFGLQDTGKLLQAITAEALVMGAGLHMVSESGQQMGGSVNNAAILYLKALEEDSAALARLHYGIESQVTVNAALIQAFGNTGTAAEEVGDKIQRMVGGLTKMSLPAGITQLQKLGATQEQLNEIFNSSGDFIANLAKVYPTLSAAVQKQIDLDMGGQRQSDAASVILKAYGENIKKATQALKDQNAESSLAEQMAGSYENSLARLDSAWEGFSIAVGTTALGALTSLIDFMGNTAIPQIEIFIGMLQDLQNMEGESYTSQVDSDRSSISEAQRMLQQQTHPSASDNVFSKLGFGVDRSPQAIHNIRQEIKDKQAQLKTDQATAHEYGVYQQALVPSDSSTYVNQWGVTEQQWVAKHHKASQFSPEFPNAAMRSEYFSGNLMKHPGAMGTETQFLASRGANIDALYASGRAALNRQAQQVKKPPPDHTAITSPKGKGLAKDYSQASQASKDYDTNLKALADAQANNASAAEAHAESLSRLMEDFGNSPTQIKQYVAAMNEAQKANESQVSLLAIGETHDQNTAKSDKSKASKFGKTTTEYKGWMSAADGAADKARELATQIQALNDKMEENSATVLKNQLTWSDKSFNTSISSDYDAAGKGTSLFSKLGSVQDARSQIQSRYNSDVNIIDSSSYLTASQRASALAAALVTLNTDLADNASRAQDAAKAITDFEQGLNKDIGSSFVEGFKSIEDALKDSGSMHGVNIKALENQVDLQVKQIDLQQQYNEKMAQAVGDPTGSAQALVQQWYNVSEMTMQAESAADQYEQKLTEIKNTPTYTATSGALDTAASSVGNSVVNSVFNQADNGQLAAINNQIAALNQEKQVDQDVYDASIFHTKQQTDEYNRENQVIEDQVKLLDQAAQQIQNQEAKPNMFKGMEENFVKDFTDSITKQMASNALSTMFNVKPDPQLTSTFQGYESAVSKYVAQSNAEDPNSFTYGIENYFYQPIQDLLNTFLPGFQQSVSDYVSASTGSVPGASGSYATNSIIDQQIGTQARGSSAGYTGPGGSELLEGGVTAAILAGGVKAGSSSQSTTSTSLISQLQGDIPKALGIAGDISIASAGVQQGGVAGSLMGAVGTDSALTGLSGLFSGGASTAGIFGGVGGILSAVAPYAAGAVLLYSLLSKKPNPADEPDIYDTQPYGQGMANVTGGGYNGTPTWGANGTQFTEDPSIYSSLGDQGEAFYIASFIKNNPTEAAQLLTPQELQEFTGYQGIQGGSNGNVGVVGANGTDMVNWQQLVNDASDASNAVENFANATNTATQALVSINQFGAGYGFVASAGMTPGYEENPANYGTAGATSTLGLTSSTNNTANTGTPNTVTAPAIVSSVTPQSVATNSNAANQAVSLNSTVQLDGMTLIRVLQSYQLNANAAGYQYVT